MLNKHRKYEKLLIFVLAALWVIGYTFLVGRADQHERDRKEIESAHQSSHAVNSDQRSNERNGIPKQPSDNKTAERGSEATDITFVGIKLGEALLVLVTVWLVLVTRDLVIGSDETSKRQLRAYVLAENCIRSGNDTYRVKIKNFGQTPAHELTVWTGIRYRTIPPSDLRTTRPENLDLSSSYLAQSNFIVAEERRILTQQELTAFLREDALIFVVGDIRYLDIFGQPQLATFRYVHGGKYGVAAPGEPLVACSEGNEAT
jgi:hypothetical protein